MPRVRLRAPDTRSPEMLDPSTRINRSPSGAPRGPRGREPETSYSFQTVVLVVSSSRVGLVLPSAAAQRPRPCLCCALCCGASAVGRPPHLPISAFARIDSRTLQVMFGSSQPPFRCSVDQAKLVHLL